MSQIRENVSLQALNTLGVPAVARYFSELNALERITEIRQFSEQQGVEIRILGGGSNLILASDLNKLVVRNCLLGTEIIAENDKTVTLKVMAGENWHQFVQWTVEQQYNGLENLALIPGTVGACPVQNIGAYGVEVQSVIVSVDAIDLHTGENVNFSNEDCRFAYRDSYFKQHENRFLITSVIFALDKQFSPVLNYGPLKELENKADLQAIDVFNKVCQIRQEKLPDPSDIPNAGSFFKNPIVTSEQRDILLKSYPDLVNFPSGNEYKLAAGWLIDRAGLKGKSNNAGVGCYQNQALVLINPKGAPTHEILSWSDEVVNQVKRMFGVVLEPEPRYWE